MYKIKNIKIKDFVIFNKVNITFNKKDKLYLIDGEYIDNKDRSNGTGKTSFTQAIIFGLFGITFRNVIKKGKQHTTVYITLENEKGDILEIYRIKKPTSSGLKIRLNGEIKTFQSIKQKQIYLNNLLLRNDNPDLYFKTVFYSNYLSNLHFINLTPSKQIQIIEELLSFNVLDKYYDKIRSKKSELKDKLLTIDNSIDVLNNEFKKNKSKRKVTLTEDILKEEKENINKLTLKLNNIKNNIKDIEEKISKLKIQTNLNDKYLKYIKKNKKCPVCKSELSNNKINELQLEYLQSKEYVNLKYKLDEENIKLQQIKNQMKFKINNLQKLNNLKNKEIIQNNEKIKELKDEILNYKKSKKQIEHKLNQYQYLYNIFNTRSKVRSNIINDYLQLLSEQVLEYLKIYDDTTKDFKLLIDDSKKFTSISILLNSLPISNLSEGEKSKVQISLILSFIYMLFTVYKCQLGIIVFDEIFNTFDKKILDITLDILNSFANKNDFQIFVIAHNKINIKKFDKKLSIRRYNDYSVITNDDIS